MHSNVFISENAFVSSYTFFVTLADHSFWIINDPVILITCHLFVLPLCMRSGAIT